MAEHPAPKPGTVVYIDILNHGKADLGMLFALLAEWGMTVAKVLPDDTLVLRERKDGEK